MTRSSTRGLTLVELMVAIAILVVALAVGVPRFEGATNSSRLAGTANELSGTLQLARAEAIRRSQHVVVCRSDDLASCTSSSNPWTGWIAFVDADADDARDAGEEILRSGSVPAGLQVRASAAIVSRDARVEFAPNGLAAGSDDRALLNATIAVCIASTSPRQNDRDVSIAFGSRIAITARDTSGSCSQPADS